jgi:diaminohydroxyphosphoribosylaminopyrimidine deaminase/5-amino-6-(5-phosphoribosylamino)uracil reductase
VGAVVVKDGRVIADGYHRRAGLAHAEADALRRAGPAARGATLYVTLEPCNHAGRTPPCCDAILAAGIARVVAAAQDPNPITRGRGFARLRRAGLPVSTGVLERPARELIAPFEHAMRFNLPLVTAKIAQSLDGKIATAAGESRWISSPRSRRLAHEQRQAADAILVGINTVIQDDPLLTVRGVRHRGDRPVKVIVDSRLRLPPRARCLSAASPAPTIVATTAARSARWAAFERRGVEILRFPSRGGRVPLRRLCRELARRGLQSVMLEGGGELLAGALSERLVSRVRCFVAPLLIGGRTAPGAVAGQGISRLSQAARLAEMSVRKVGPDLCVEARVAYATRRSR